MGWNIFKDFFNFQAPLVSLMCSSFFIKIISREKKTNIAWDVPSKLNLTLLIHDLILRYLQDLGFSIGYSNQSLTLHSWSFTYYLRKFFDYAPYLHLFPFRQNCSDLTMDQGTMLAHPGRVTHFHEGLPTTSGTRLVWPQLCCSWRSWKWLNEDFNSNPFFLFNLYCKLINWKIKLKWNQF